MFLEPSAQIRVWANAIAQMVSALEQQGFSREEALDIAKAVATDGS